jgi:hypothetical protein
VLTVLTSQATLTTALVTCSEKRVSPADSHISRYDEPRRSAHVPITEFIGPKMQARQGEGIKSAVEPAQKKGK